MTHLRKAVPDSLLETIITMDPVDGVRAAIEELRLRRGPTCPACGDRWITIDRDPDKEVFHHAASERGEAGSTRTRPPRSCTVVWR